MTLGFEIRLVNNPWPETVPDFSEILTHAAEDRARGIAERVANGDYRRDSMAFVVLDPTAPISRATEDAVLAMVCVGEDGPRFAANAMAKAAEHRDHGLECGSLALAQKHRLADGDFRNGFSVEVGGTIVGASGQNSLQDQYEATLLAARLNYEIGRARLAWEEAQGRGGWFSNAGQAGKRYCDVWTRPALEVLHSPPS
jgi:hypothetical protein